MHWKSQLLKVQQQIIATQADAGQSAAEALLSQNLNNTHVSTSAGASHEFISRKLVGDVVSFGVFLYVVSWGTYEGCDVAAIFNHTGSHRNDVNPVRNVTNKADADLGVAHSYVRFFSFAFHVVEACNQYSFII